MSYIETLITQAKELDQRGDLPILFIDNFELDYDKFYEQKRYYSMWFETWICTDTRVGGTILFFDDKPFGLTWQQCRKCDSLL